jgi:imidazolonepropionase-like amidohydrolase
LPYENDRNLAKTDNSRLDYLEGRKMKELIQLLILFLLSTHLVFTQDNHLLLKNINYIDVVEGKEKKASILIENGLIKEIAKKINSNLKMKIVNGDGKWLIPGLVDAHIHLFQSGGLYTRPDVIDLREYQDYGKEREWLKDNAEDLLKRYLRLGITTVVDVGGPLYNLKIRDSLKNKKKLPNLFLTGPLISTYQPEAFKIDDPPIIRAKTKEEAVEMVQKQLLYKPDFIKIWYIVLPKQTAESTYELVKAAIDESHKNGLRVAVHATELKTAKLAIKAGADMLVHSVDEEIDREFISLLIENSVVYVPTLLVDGKYLETFSQNLQFTSEDYSFSNPRPLSSFFDSKNFFKVYESYIPKMKENLEKRNHIRFENLKQLSKEQVIISTGTDAGNIGTLHASSYYQEIAFMKKAGLTNAQILSASTINGAKALGKEKQFGSIDIGKEADLIILNSNPLENIDAIKDIQYVIKGGNILSSDSILIESPENLVQQQVNGYNARNIQAFLKPYSENFEIYNFPNKLLYKGKNKIKPGYESLFRSSPNLHCEILNRTVFGNTVIDHERVTGIPGIEKLESVAIYKINKGKIDKVYFIDMD